MKKWVLLVDDDEAILEVVKIVLEGANFEVGTATNSGLMEAFLKGKTPDLIFLDVLLSGEDGTEVCRTLKRNDHTKDIPVVMLSAHSSAGKISLACGADGFLAKPFDIDELVKTAKKYALGKT